MAFDTLTYAKKLQEAGVPPQQAEVHAWALKEQVEATLATKQDIQLLQKDLRDLETRMEGRFKELETRIDGKFKDVDSRFADVYGCFRLLYWMVGFNLTLTLFSLSLTTAILLKLLAR